MGKFAVHSMVQRAIGSAVNIYVKEGKVVVFLRLHGELNVLVNTAQVAKKSLSLSGPRGQMMKVSI
jgi:hypothetical protein